MQATALTYKIKDTSGDEHTGRGSFHSPGTWEVRVLDSAGIWGLLLHRHEDRVPFLHIHIFVLTSSSRGLW